MKSASKIILITLLYAVFNILPAQQKVLNPPPMNLDVNRIQMTFNKKNGEGGFATQFSWMLTGTNPQQTEIFFWPRDNWQSNLLYQIYSPVCLDENGILDTLGVVNQNGISYRGTITNGGSTDWAREVRRYRPPHIKVNGITIDPPYRWFVDPALKSDIKLEFEDVCAQFGMRSHVEVFASSNPNHGDYYIWKATHKFTGELKVPRENLGKSRLPDQTINFYWPIAWSFGPSKAGEYYSHGSFGYEGEDDLDSWFKGNSNFGTSSVARDTLYVAYYWDYLAQNIKAYPANSGGIASGSLDDSGDPDRETGYLYANQIPGYTLLYADKSASDKSDNPRQPYAITHGSINDDFWGHNPNYKGLYTGNASTWGRFPLDVMASGKLTKPDKGPMRFMVTGPYSLTKDAKNDRYDSVTFVYAVGVGSIGDKMADSVGKLWMQGKITDAEKNAWILKGRDSLFVNLDKANWAWKQISSGNGVPTPPPPPDIEVNSGPDSIQVKWSYPDAAYFNDGLTGVDDWYAWRVYRKRGAYWVNDPLDKKSGARWEMLAEITDRNKMEFWDKNVARANDYYYAVTSVDNGSQNNNIIDKGAKLESSRYMNATQVAATSFKAGLDYSNKVRVVPNPYTIRQGSLRASGANDRISFLNLPFKCKLRVYTETGNLVWTKEHKGTADENWEQRTDDNQIIVSGIYLLAVTNGETPDGKTIDNSFVKFVVIR